MKRFLGLVMPTWRELPHVREASVYLLADETRSIRITFMQNPITLFVDTYNWLKASRESYVIQRQSAD